MTLYVGRVSHLQLRLAVNVSIGELMHQLRNTNLAISQHDRNVFVVHRLPAGLDTTRPRIPCDGQPEPPRAA